MWQTIFQPWKTFLLTRMSFMIFVVYNIGASHRSIKDNLVFSSLDNKFPFNWDFDSIYTVGIHLQVYFFELKLILCYLSLFKFFLGKIFSMYEIQCYQIFGQLGRPYFIENIVLLQSCCFLCEKKREIVFSYVYICHFIEQMRFPNHSKRGNPIKINQEITF